MVGWFECQVGLYTPHRRVGPHPDVVDRMMITLMVGMQALYPFPDPLLPTPVGWEGEAAWGMHGRVVRVPGGPLYPPPSGRTAPGRG